jgi:hypothetical protein
LGAQWAFFIDDDITIMYPSVETLLTLDGDLVSCHRQIRTPVAVCFWYSA